jgi:uncharacterized protein (TIGR02646 family)
MRFVERSACPSELDGVTSLGGDETRRAIAHYADRATRSTSFSFEAYKTPAVKDALTAMFGGKCAYCESDYSATAPMDVEHYRPKGAITTGSGQRIAPGYYWLAAEWANLLPSCIDCNRKREHRNGRGSISSSGKANAFPLADESTRARHPGDESHEVPLLLKHYVRPTTVSGAESDRGRATIVCLGLNRDGLERGRRAQLGRVDTAIQHYRESVEELDAAPGNAKWEARVRRNMKALCEFFGPCAPYSTMAWQRAKAVIPDLVPKNKPNGPCRETS